MEWQLVGGIIGVVTFAFMWWGAYTKLSKSLESSVTGLSTRVETSLDRLSDRLYSRSESIVALKTEVAVMSATYVRSADCNARHHGEQK